MAPKAAPISVPLKTADATPTASKPSNRGGKKPPKKAEVGKLIKLVEQSAAEPQAPPQAAAAIAVTAEEKAEIAELQNLFASSSVAAKSSALAPEPTVEAAPAVEATPAPEAPLPSADITAEPLPPEIHGILTRFDDPLVKVLEQGDIRLLRTSWLLAQPDNYRLQNRQELEALEAAGASPSPLLRPEEAAALVRKGTRSAGSASHGWLMPGHPDPACTRVKLLRRELRQRPYIEAIFFDYASLYQGQRNEAQQAAFLRALKVMGDLYASAIGMTVLQIKEIPKRPKEYDGALALFGLKVRDKSSITQAFKEYGTVVSCEVGGHPEAKVFLSTHEAALHAKESAPKLVHICDGIDTLYNERSYDGRTGEAGRDNDDGRGWCHMESAASSELLMRLKAYPKMQEALDKLGRPKLLLLSSNESTAEVDLQDSELATRVEEVTLCITKAHFIGRGDKPMVIQTYRDYVDRMGTMLTQALAALSLERRSGVAEGELLPLPTVDAPSAPQLRLAAGQALLVLPPEGDESRSAGGHRGDTRFGVVGESGRVTLTIARGEVEVAYDACVQAVLPWQPEAAYAELVRHVEALPALAEMARPLLASALALKADSLTEKQLEGMFVEVKRVAGAMSKNPLRRGAAEAAMSAIRAKGATAGALGTRLLALQDAVARQLSFEPESVAAEALRSSSALGLRCYVSGQWLSVKNGGGWRDAQVVRVGSSTHTLRLDGGSDGKLSLALHPWNHAPRELPFAAFEALREWWAQSMRAQHTHIADALTGKPLDALDQCVAIEVTGSAADLSSVRDVRGLSAWLHSLHSARGGGAATDETGAALLTAPPAAGKTTLISQAVVLALKKAELVPIVIKVQLLQARLRASPDEFTSQWNWVDAYLRLVYLAEKPEVYRMLRQAMMARRALLLIDGLDEGGTNRAEIERHVVQVLAAQGHVMMCTSRPAGVDEGQFAGVRRLKLAPLTEVQQREALVQRLGDAGVAKLMPFVERMPMDVDPETKAQHRVTSNPLMLSMVASVFEFRQGIDMPKTVAKLYETASDLMLARGGVVSVELRTLLEAVLFEAHAAQARLITDKQLSRAALAVWAPPGTLVELDQRLAERIATSPLPKYGGRAEVGHYVEIVKEGEYKYQHGVIFKDAQDSRPYKVRLANGKETNWLCPKDLVSSGMDEAACFARLATADGEYLPALQRAIDSLLSEEAKQAVEVMRERVKQDNLPLLSLLQVDPLQMQSSHLSFQEYFTATAICSGKYRLPKGSPPPWQWPAFWANAVKLGGEMGEAFGYGLMRTAGCDGPTLDLTGKLCGGGDLPTAAAAVAQIIRGAGSLGSLTCCNVLMNGDKMDAAAARLLVDAAEEKSISLCGITSDQTTADFSRKGLKAPAAMLLASDLSKANASASLTKISLRGNELWDEGTIVVCDALLESKVSRIKELDLSYNRIGLPGAESVAAYVAVTASLTTLDISSNRIGCYFDGSKTIFTPEGPKAIADALLVNTSLTKISLRGNELLDEGTIVVCDALRESKVSRIEELDLSQNRIGLPGAESVAAYVAVTASLTKIDVRANALGDDGKAALRKAVEGRSGFQLVL